MTKEQICTLEAEYDAAVDTLNRVLVTYVVLGNSRLKWGKYSNWNQLNTCTTKTLEDTE